MAVTDLFRKYKSLHSTTLSASISTGTSETITFGSVTNVPTDTEVTMTIDRVDSSGTETPTKMERITGTVVGSALTSYTRAIDNTTDQAHSSGAVVEMVWNAEDLNDLIDGILAEHSQAGAHTADVIAEKTSATGVTVDGVELKDGGLTPPVFIGDTANTGSTLGLTINQGAADDEIIALKSSDVAHGITDLTETDTYARILKADGVSGGLLIDGMKDADGVAGRALFFFGSLGEAADTTKSTDAHGIMHFAARVKSGTGTADVGADGNLLTIVNRGTTRFIFDAEGTGHADDSWAAFSDSRLKKDQKELEYGLDEIMKLKPKTYTKYSGHIEKGKTVLEGNGRKMIGLVAQEVEEVMPKAIKKPPNKESFYSMSYDPIVTTLVKAVQELTARLEVLEK